LREPPDDSEVAVLAATDPANPYGATLKWASRRSTPNPQNERRSASSASSAANVVAEAGRTPTRSVGATVILVDGALAAYLARGDRQLVTYLPESEPERSKTGRAIARVLIDRARTGGESPRGMLIEEIDGVAPATHPMARFLTDAGFVSGALGLQAKLQHSSHQSPVVRPQSQVTSRQPGVVNRQSKSSISSPFARRYLDNSDVAETDD